MMKKIATFGMLLILLSLSPVYAASIGQMSGNILGPATGLGHVLNAVCYITGVGFLLCGLLQYKYHRENPQQVRLSTPIALWLVGLALVGLPFLAMLSTSASFLKS